MRRNIEYPERPSSEQLVDLHVYIVPPDIWRGRYNDVLSSQINETVSAGFLRVDPQLKIYGLRDEIDQQLGIDVSLIPRDYVFLKSVGRSLTRVKPKQEYQLKVKNFIPPQAYLPEIFVLELTAEIKAAFAVSGDDSSRSITRTSTHHDDSARLPALYHRQPYDRDADSGLYENGRYAPVSSGGGQMAYSGQPGTHDQYPSPYSAAYSQGYPQHNIHSENSGVDSAPIQSQSTPLPNSSAPSPGYQSNSNIDHRQPLQPPSSHSRHDSASRGGMGKDRSEHLLSRPGFNAYDQLPKIPTDNQNKEALNSHFNETVRLDDIARSPHLYGHDNQVESMGYPNVSRPSPPSHEPSDVDGNLRPLSATPPHSPEKEQHYGSGIHSSGKPPRSPRATTDQLERGPLFTDSTNDDSGIAGFTPDHRNNRERYDVNDRQRRQQGDERKSRSDKDRYEELENHLGPGQPQSRRTRDDHRDDDSRTRHDNHRDSMLDDEDEERWQQQERLRLAEQNERIQREDADRVGKQASALEQQENDERHMEEERRRLENERQALIDQSNELLNDYANPPGDMGQPLSEEEKQQKKQDRERLQAELDSAREARKTIERQREDLVKKAKLLQTKTQNRRNHARDVWKKKYFEEKKRTGPLEEQTNRLRHELDQIHRKLMNSLEGSKDKMTKQIDNTPSQQNNFKIQATRLQHEIEDIRRRVDNSKMKLTAEMKLRNQAENELRSLRADLTQKKINLTLTRSQQMASLLSSQDMNINHNPTARQMITPRS